MQKVTLRKPLVKTAGKLEGPRKAALADFLALALNNGLEAVRVKPKSKQPAGGRAWNQLSEASPDDTTGLGLSDKVARVQGWLEDGENYGLMARADAGLVIYDIDLPESEQGPLREIFPEFWQTLRVVNRHNGTFHCYFSIMPDDAAVTPTGLEKPYGRGSKKQILGPGSRVAYTAAAGDTEPYGTFGRIIEKADILPLPERLRQAEADAFSAGLDDEPEPVKTDEPDVQDNRQKVLAIFKRMGKAPKPYRVPASIPDGETHNTFIEVMARAAWYCAREDRPVALYRACGAEVFKRFEGQSCETLDAKLKRVLPWLHKEIAQNRTSARQIVEDRPAFSVRDSDTLVAACQSTNLVHAWRYNNRSAQLEYQLGPDDEWASLDDPFWHYLMEELEKRCCYLPEGQDEKKAKPLVYYEREQLRAKGALAFKYECDPFREYLESVRGCWDGKARISHILRRLFRAKDSKITEWASRFPFIGAVQRTFEPGVLIRECPVLIGPQRLGKSSFYRNLFPEHKQECWFSDTFSFAQQNQARNIEAVMGCVIAEIAEMKGATSATLEKVKAELSRVTDRYRLPWDRHVSRLRRKFIFAGTADKTDVLPDDPAGNTRFVPVEVFEGVGQSIEEYLRPIRSQLWAEALFRYESQHVRAPLPIELWNAQKRLVEQYRYRDYDAEDRIDDALAELLKNKGDGFRIRDILEKANHQAKVGDLGAERKREISSYAVAKRLKTRGYTCQHTRQGNLWSKN